jgi:hypothetical protein
VPSLLPDLDKKNLFVSYNTLRVSSPLVFLPLIEIGTFFWRSSLIDWSQYHFGVIRSVKVEGTRIFLQMKYMTLKHGLSEFSFLRIYVTDYDSHKPLFKSSHTKVRFISTFPTRIRSES